MLLCITSCATKPAVPRASDVKNTYVDNDGSEVIELQNPYQKGIMDEITPAKKLTAHTVYDNQEDIEKFQQQKKAKVIEKISAFKFYNVKENESLSSIARTLYGDRRKWKTLHSWNYDVLPNENNIKKGIRIRYLPHDKLMALEKKKSNRLPASEK